jgi:hypothetical protein
MKQNLGVYRFREDRELLKICDTVAENTKQGIEKLVSQQDECAK